MAKLYTQLWVSNINNGLLKWKAWYLGNYMYFTYHCTFKGIFVHINKHNPELAVWQLYSSEYLPHENYIKKQFLLI